MRILIGILSVTCAVAFPAEAQNQPTKLRIVVVAGEDSVNVIQQRTAVAPIVEVRDQNDHPVAGAAVTFAVRSGSAKATLGNGLQQLVVTTDAAGRATVAVNPVANGAIQIQASAQAGGQTASVTISQTNVATAAEAAKASAGAGGGHTGLIITSAAIAGGGIAGWQYYEKQTEAEDGGCGFAVSAPPIAVPAAGGNFTFSFEVNCDWVATTDQPWLTLTGPTSGVENKDVAALIPVTLTYRVQPNQSTASRLGRILWRATTAGAGPPATFEIPITQAGAPASGLFVLSGPAVIDAAAHSCPSAIVIQAMRVELFDQSGAATLTAGGCGANARYSPARVSKSGNQVSARFLASDASAPPIDFDGILEGNAIRAFVVIGGLRVPISLIAN